MQEEEPLNHEEWLHRMGDRLRSIFGERQPRWFSSDRLTLVLPQYALHLLPDVENEVARIGQLYDRSAPAVDLEPYGWSDRRFHSESVSTPFSVDRLVESHQQREDAGERPIIYLVPHLYLDAGHPHEQGRGTIGLTDFGNGLIIQSLGDKGLGLSLARHSLAHEIGHLFGPILDHHDLARVVEGENTTERPYSVTAYPGDADAECNMRYLVNTATTRVCERCLYGAGEARRILRSLPRE